MTQDQHTPAELREMAQRIANWNYWEDEDIPISMAGSVATALLAALDREAVKDKEIERLTTALELGESVRAGLEAHNEQDRVGRERLQSRVDELERYITEQIEKEPIPINSNVVVEGDGMTDNHVQAVEIPDYINLVGDERFSLVEGGFKIKGRVFAYHQLNGNVGNIFWDCAWVTREVAAALLNHLQSLGDWDCEEAMTRLWNKWQAGKPFVAEDFK